MRNSILGFNQEFAAGLYKTVEKSGKETILKLDVSDLTILRWLVDFSHTGKMETVSIEGNLYYWVSYNKVIEDLPLLNIGKDMLYRRLKKMVELEILTYYSKSGGQAYFGFGKNYEHMLSSEYSRKSEGSENIPSVSENNPSSVGKNSEAPSENIPTNNILNNKSLNKSLNNKKESKKENSFDEIINDYTNDEKTKMLLGEWLKVRKAKRAAMTNYAISLNIKKLDNLASQSNMSVNQYLEEVIARGWQAFFVINNYKSNNQPNQASQSTSVDLSLNNDPEYINKYSDINEDELNF